MHKVNNFQLARPPVIATVVGLQFDVLRDFQTVHHGWFWQNYLRNNGWTVTSDEVLLPSFEESFESKKLQLSKKGLLDQKVRRLKLTDDLQHKTLQIQPDKLILGSDREKDVALDYFKLKTEFACLFQEFCDFTASADIGTPKPNLWEVTYINQIDNSLWQTPNDWGSVIPGLFPSNYAWLPQTLSFATFQGDWHFEITPKRGRVHLHVAKMMREGRDEPVLYVRLTARGALSETDNWSDNLDLGHRSCIELFHNLTSDKAHEFWGITYE